MLSKIQQWAFYWTRQGSEEDECLASSSNFIGAIKYFTILCVRFLIWICLWLSPAWLRGTNMLLCKMSDASTMHRRTPVSCSWTPYRRNAHTGRIIHSNASETTTSGTWFFCLNMCWIAKRLQTLHKAQWSGKKTLFLQSRNVRVTRTASRTSNSWLLSLGIGQAGCTSAKQHTGYYEIANTFSIQNEAISWSHQEATSTHSRGSFKVLVWISKVLHSEGPTWVSNALSPSLSVIKQTDGQSHFFTYFGNWIIRAATGEL